MNLKEALLYLNEHEEFFNDPYNIILGIAYTPDDADADFYSVEFLINQDLKAEHGVIYYNALFEGGYLSNPDKFIKYLGDHEIEELVEQLPDFAKNLQYKVLQLKNRVREFEYPKLLKSLFPSLPDPDECNPDVFKTEVLKLIADFNTSNFEITYS